MYSLTVFKSPRWWEKEQRFVYDNKTHRRIDFESWDRFTAFLRKLSERPLNGKQDAELISPAIFKPDSKRRNENVLAWAGWAAVDVDDIEIDGAVGDYIYNRYGEWDYIVYSTASSTIDKPKFRIIFRLAEPIQHTQIKHFWWALNSELNSIGDTQTKDLARMYYIPATYANANNFFYVNSGRPLDIDYLLARWPYDEKRDSKNFMDRLPPAWREQILDYKKAKLDNTSYVWSDYNDCPFVNKKILNEYMSIANIDGTGRYRMIYKIMISIAANALEKQYPITATQLVDLIKQIDRDTSNRYQNRPLDVEANNALEYVYRNGVIS
jgi:hypothetical protein